MPDGVSLAADLFVPEDGEARHPILIEYLPYRKCDQTWDGYYWGHRYLAERGFVVARIDVRGTGDSEGTALDEYCEQEQLDGVAAIAWLAQQPWSTGRVGMFGTSYGGFNSLQVAMHRPPALGAISPMYFTDRRYTDDCHYKGGAMQMFYDVGTYGLSMVGRNLLPPRPDLTGEKWAEIWEGHLQSEPWVLRWLVHQTEDEQWRQGSLCEAYASIQCPTFLIGGWRDGYTNCNLRTYAALTCPKKLLVGPWLHARPSSGVPGPRINHWREMARFFAHWLRDEDTGVMDEPPIALYVQGYDPPRADRRETSGYWRAFGGVPETIERVFELTPGELAYDPSVGTTFGMFSAGQPYVLPADQREEEARSLIGLDVPVDEALEVVGQGRVAIEVEATAEVVTFVARLCDVAPDGSSALVTKGVLNATHRESHADPSPLVPGRRYELSIDLDATAWRFEPGHRVRLSISNADFPNTWPSPTPATSRIHSGRLALPVVGPPSLPAPVFEPGEPDGRAEPPDWRVTRDLGRGVVEVRTAARGTSRVDDYATNENEMEAVARVSTRDPARAAMTGTQTARLHWPGRTIELRTRGHIESDANAFHVTLHAAISADGLPHFERHWVRSYPRYLL